MVGPLRQELRVLGLITSSQNTQSPAQHSSGPGQCSAASNTSTARGQGAVSGNAPKSAQTGAGMSPTLSQQQQRNVFRSVRVEWVQLKPRPCVMVSFVLPPSNKAARMSKQDDREAYWKESSKGTLPLDALVCFAMHGQPLMFATVVSSLSCCGKNIYNLCRGLHPHITGKCPLPGFKHPKSHRSILRS